MSVPERTTTCIQQVVESPVPGGKEGPMITILITVVAVISVTVTVSIRIKRR